MTGQKKVNDVTYTQNFVANETAKGNTIETSFDVSIVLKRKDDLF